MDIRLIFIILIIAFTPWHAMAQSEPASGLNNSDSVSGLPDVPHRNAFSFGFLGDGSALSLGYERLGDHSPRRMASFRIGAGYFLGPFICNVNCGVPFEVFTFPHHFTFNTGKSVPAEAGRSGGSAIAQNIPQNRHFFEYGYNGVMYISREDDPAYLAMALIGYRLHTKIPGSRHDFIFRAFVTMPFYRTGAHHDKMPVTIGISFGRTF